MERLRWLPQTVAGGNQSQNPPDVRVLRDCVCAFEVTCREVCHDFAVPLPVMDADTTRLTDIHRRFGSSAACLREPISAVSNDDDVDLQWIGSARFTVTVQA